MEYISYALMTATLMVFVFFLCNLDGDTSFSLKKDS